MHSHAAFDAIRSVCGVCNDANASCAPFAWLSVVRRWKRIVTSYGVLRDPDTNRGLLLSKLTHSATLNSNSTINNKTIKIFQHNYIQVLVAMFRFPCILRNRKTILVLSMFPPSIVRAVDDRRVAYVGLTVKISILYICARIVAIFISFACQCGCYRCCWCRTKRCAAFNTKRIRDTEKAKYETAWIMGLKSIYYLMKEERKSMNSLISRARAYRHKTTKGRRKKISAWIIAASNAFCDCQKWYEYRPQLTH